MRLLSDEHDEQRPPRRRFAAAVLLFVPRLSLVAPRREPRRSPLTTRARSAPSFDFWRRGRRRNRRRFPRVSQSRRTRVAASTPRMIPRQSINQFVHRSVRSRRPVAPSASQGPVPNLPKSLGCVERDESSGLSRGRRPSCDLVGWFARLCLGSGVLYALGVGSPFGQVGRGLTGGFVRPCRFSLRVFFSSVGRVVGFLRFDSTARVPSSTSRRCAISSPPHRASV